MTDAKAVDFAWPDLDSDRAQAKRMKERKEAKVKAHLSERSEYRFWDHWLDDRQLHLFVQPGKGGLPHAGSSVEIEHCTPAATSCGSGCSSSDGTTPTRTFALLSMADNGYSGCRRHHGCDELPAFHSITSFARARSVDGAVRPSALFMVKAAKPTFTRSRKFTT